MSRAPQPPMRKVAKVGPQVVQRTYTLECGHKETRFGWKPFKSLRCRECQREQDEA